jgi:hypothetical protein
MEGSRPARENRTQVRTVRCLSLILVISNNKIVSLFTAYRTFEALGRERSFISAEPS